MRSEGSRMAEKGEGQKSRLEGTSAGSGRRQDPSRPAVVATRIVAGSPIKGLGGSEHVMSVELTTTRFVHSSHGCVVVAEAEAEAAGPSGRRARMWTFGVPAAEKPAPMTETVAPRGRAAKGVAAATPVTRKAEPSGERRERVKVGAAVALRVPREWEAPSRLVGKVVSEAAVGWETRARLDLVDMNLRRGGRGRDRRCRRNV